MLPGAKTTTTTLTKTLVGPMPLASSSNKTAVASAASSLPVVVRKRTFANIVWPLDPEEERILRSNSPIIVPEVIVQRNDRVKSILKKSSFGGGGGGAAAIDLTATGSVSCTAIDRALVAVQTEQNNEQQQQPQQQQQQQQTVSMCSASGGGKKKVDFLENFCFVNFFDIHNDNGGELDSSNESASAVIDPST